MTDAPQPRTASYPTRMKPKTELDSLHVINTAAPKRSGWRYGLSVAAMLGMGLMVTTVFAANANALTSLPIPAAATDVGPTTASRPASASHDANTCLSESWLSTGESGPAIAKKTAPPEAEDVRSGRAYRATLRETEKRPHRRLHASPAPYALQLGVFRSMQNARQGAARYREKGVSASWQTVKKGQLYRVVAGKFETARQANLYKRAHALDKAMIINVPLTVRVLPKRPDSTHAQIRHFLAEIGYDSHMETGLTAEPEVYTGLFRSLANAAAVADRINDSGRFLAWVVCR
jgi:cell division septation protein DedD